MHHKMEVVEVEAEEEVAVETASNVEKKAIFQENVLTKINQVATEAEAVAEVAEMEVDAVSAINVTKRDILQGNVLMKEEADLTRDREEKTVVLLEEKTTTTMLEETMPGDKVPEAGTTTMQLLLTMIMHGEPVTTKVNNKMITEVDGDLEHEF
jgi:hypothetical protein